MNAPLGTQATSVATCTGGMVLLGGGARVTTNDTTNEERVILQRSFPTGVVNGIWTGVGVVTNANLELTQTMTVRAFALCGNP
jgi:hypothetical protein